MQSEPSVHRISDAVSFNAIRMFHQLSSCGTKSSVPAMNKMAVRGVLIPANRTRRQDSLNIVFSGDEKPNAPPAY
jgi:hypothetical protein